MHGLAPSLPVDAERPGAARWAWSLRVLAAVALLYLLRDAKALLAPVVVAVVLTFVLTPLVRTLRRIGIPEILGAGLVVAGLIGTVVPMTASLAPPATLWWERAPQVINQLFARLDRLRAAVPGLAPPAATPQPAQTPSAGSRVARSSAPPAPPAADPVKERLASEGVALTGTLIGRGSSFALAATATLILLYFLLASEHWMLSRCVEAVPRRRTRALVLGGLRTAQREIGRYLISVSFMNAGVGLVSGLVIWWLGLPNPMLWGTVTAVLNFVPYIGPLVVVALLGLAGAFTFTTVSAMAAPALAFIAIHAVESNIVSPWVVGRRLALSPISVFLSVMFWGWLWGIAGALIAVPLLIGVRTVCRRTRRLRTLCRFIDGETRAVPTLRSLLDARRLRRRGKPPVPAPAAALGVVVSEPVDVAQAGGVHILPDVTGEVVAVARPFQHDTGAGREIEADTQPIRPAPT
jgi:predicted PurR-regulated permease PerM